MKKLIEHHRQIWTRKFAMSVTVGLVLFISSLIINYYAVVYSSNSISGTVTDIILSNVRVYDVDGIIVFTSMLLILIGVLKLAREPQKLPFVLKAIAFFITTRSIFISLTHLAPFSPHLMIQPNQLVTILGLGSADDLFFSGHTGLPFLAALFFWRDKIPRYIFLAGSAILAVSVLLGHLHYSIDVFSAFFITYAIFEITKKLFAADWERF